MSNQPEQSSIAGRLAGVHENIRSAAVAAERPEDAAELVAVSKTFPAEVIREALEAGQRVFGENRLQDAEGKWPGLREEYDDVELHMIGSIQTRKAKAIVGLFDVIQTVDREKLARALKKAMDEIGRCPVCYIQVNTGSEPQKGGVEPREADAFIRLCRDEIGLEVVGLMAIPPADQEPAPHFALLKKIAERNGLQKLSMGMSADYELAVRFGATSVRVGSAIFGARTPVAG